MAGIVRKPIACLLCSFTSGNEDEFLEHSQLHRYAKNFKLPCFSCDAILGSYKVHKRHMKTHESDSAKEKDEENSESGFFWNCELCPEKIKVKSEPNLKNFKKVCTHLSKHVKKEIVHCPRATCKASFHLYTSFNNHFNKHKVNC